MADVTQDPEAWARLGVKIRERREAMGLSRRQLSQEAGVSEKSIQTAEEGRIPRARWPQSLRLIENALRWESGSMERILEGGEAESRLDLFSLMEEDSAIADQVSLFPDPGARRLEELAHEQGREMPGPDTRGYALAQFPPVLRKALPDVIDFGHKAVTHGADPEVAERYEEAVEALLMDMIGRRLAYEGSPSDPGVLWLWRDALKRDPVLQKERDERRLAYSRELRRLRESAQREETLLRAARMSVVGEDESGQILKELRRLAQEVERLAKKVDSETSPGEAS